MWGRYLPSPSLHFQDIFL
uniref:Uncharacterized protein n=1 Tax=Anguilla anguilla TaxID=7936 RepID=A0A0E9P782_ANGAN